MSLSHDPLQYLVQSHPWPQSQVGSKEVERVQETKPVNRGLLDSDFVIEVQDDVCSSQTNTLFTLLYIDLSPQAGKEAVGLKEPGD